MEPLVTNRRCLTWLCICEADKSTNRWKKFAHAIYAVTVVVGCIGAFASSFAYSWKFASIDLGKSLFSLMFVAAEITAIYSALVGMILMRHKIDPIFNSLSTIYRAHENTDSFHLLEHVNNTSEWMWEIFLKITAVAIISNLTVAPLMSILFNWLTSKNLRVENLYHPVPFLLPWNQSTPIGYVGELCHSIPIGLGYFSVNGGFLLLFISICQHHQAFYKMLKQKVKKLNRTGENNQCDSKFLRDLIRFHLLIKDWFFLTAKVYDSFIAIQLICNEIVLGISIFYLDYQFQQLSIDITIGITEFLLGMTNLLIYCYLGKLANASYAKMPNRIFYMKWFELPNKLQRYYILMIKNMQIPLYYRGFGVIHLDLETFTKLFRSAISFYLSIKAVTSK